MKTTLVYFFLFAFWAEQALGISLSQIKGFSLSNFAVYLLLFAWAFKIAFQRKFFESNNVNTYLMLMIFIALVSIPLKIWHGEIPSEGVLNELIHWKDWADPLILFFILFNVIDDERSCKGVLLGLILFLFITALTTPLISLGVIHIRKLPDFYYGRASGFSDPNQYASFLVLFIPLVLTYFLFTKYLITKMAIGILLAVSFIALVTTGSRGGAISFLLSMAIYLLLMKRENILNFNYIILVLIALMILSFSSFVLAPSSVKEHVMSRFDPTDSETMDEISGAHGRAKFWQNGLRFFMERPILGHGQNTFSLLNKKKFGGPGAPHNHFLMQLVHFGIVGLTIYIMIFTKVFLHVWHDVKATKDLWRRKLYISFIAGFLGYTFSMLAVDLGPPRYLFWIYTAIMYSYIKSDPSRIT
jgi:O-antigen ligase